jgi:phage regulator Rha-like protein
MRDIREILSKCSQYLGASNFAAASYKSKQNRKCPCTAFQRRLHVMVDMGGFTGAKARALPLSISPSLFFRQKPCAHEHLLPMNEET